MELIGGEKSQEHFLFKPGPCSYTVHTSSSTQLPNNRKMYLCQDHAPLHKCHGIRIRWHPNSRIIKHLLVSVYSSPIPRCRIIWKGFWRLLHSLLTRFVKNILVWASIYSTWKILLHSKLNTSTNVFKYWICPSWHPY